jgi:hypothetical protein
VPSSRPAGARVALLRSPLLPTGQALSLTSTNGDHPNNTLKDAAKLESTLPDGAAQTNDQTIGSLAPAGPAAYFKVKSAHVDGKQPAVLSVTVLAQAGLWQPDEAVVDIGPPVPDGDEAARRVRMRLGRAGRLIASAATRREPSSSPFESDRCGRRAQEGTRSHRVPPAAAPRGSELPSRGRSAFPSCRTPRAPSADRSRPHPKARAGGP